MSSHLFNRDRVMETEKLIEQEDFVTLYRLAFSKYGTSALWSSRPVAEPTREDALAVTSSLRVEGDLDARRLAEKIEKACHAAV